MGQSTETSAEKKKTLVSEALTSIPHDLSCCKNKIGRAERKRVSVYKVQVIRCVEMCDISKLCKAFILMVYKSSGGYQCKKICLKVH